MLIRGNIYTKVSVSLGDNLFVYLTSKTMRAKLVVLLTAILLASTGFAAPTMTPLELYLRINPDYSCTKYKISGVCKKNGVIVGYKVKMSVPVAFIETLPGPGETLLFVPNFGTLLGMTVGKAFSVGQSNKSGMDNSFEAKVWSLPDSAMLLSRIMPKCLVCMPSDSYDLLPALPAPPSSGCDAIDVVSSKLYELTRKMPSIPLMPSLGYSTEVDTLNWRTGCRDITLTNVLQSNNFTCSAAAVSGQVDKIVSKLGGSNPLSRFFGNDTCLGAWGPLFPRQMRDIGNVATVGSAKTAYRALSVAKTQFGGVKFPVGLEGKFQQAYPTVSACFGPGDSPLPTAPFTLKPVVTSPDGAYGWIYWRPVSCCVSLSTLAKCAASPKN